MASKHWNTFSPACVCLLKDPSASVIPSLENTLTDFIATSCPSKISRTSCGENVNKMVFRLVSKHCGCYLLQKVYFSLEKTMSVCMMIKQGESREERLRGSDIDTCSAQSEKCF